MGADAEPSREDLEFERFQARLAAALLAGDPGGALEALRADPETRSQVEHAAEDGLRMSALIIARLRFERLLNGSLAATRAYRDDAEHFTVQFRRYHHAVPPRATHPAAEAAAYEAWLAEGGTE